MGFNGLGKRRPFPSPAKRLMAVANRALTRHLEESDVEIEIRKLWGHATGTQGHVSIDRNWYTPETYIEMAREVGKKIL